MNNKHLSWYKEINNNFILASRAYFLHVQHLFRTVMLGFLVMWRDLVSGASDLCKSSTTMTTAPRHWSLGARARNFLTIIDQVKPAPIGKWRQRRINNIVYAVVLESQCIFILCFICFVFPVNIDDRSKSFSEKQLRGKILTSRHTCFCE